MGAMCSKGSDDYVVNGGPPTTKDGVPLPTRGVRQERGGHAGDGGGDHWHSGNRASVEQTIDKILGRR